MTWISTLQVLVFLLNSLMNNTTQYTLPLKFSKISTGYSN